MKLNKLLILLGLILAYPSSAKIEPSNNQVIGDGQASDKKITFNRGGSNPGFKWDEAAGELKFTNDGSSYVGFSSAAGAMKNYLANSNFELWQRGTTVVITDGNFSYQADRWYVVNTLGTNGVITYSQVAGVSEGAKYGAKVQISTAPTAAQNNGTEFFQTIENPLSLELYNQTASLSMKVKALNNVTQVGLQFMYKTTEAKVDTTIGSESLCTVNSSTFSNCSIAGQALGTSMTTSGVIGVRVRITAVSSGNTYDLNNGYVVELPMLNKGVAAAAWQRMGSDFADELHYCQRFYEKSYDLNVDPGTITNDGNMLFTCSSSNAQYSSWFYNTRKRVAGTHTVYNPNSGLTTTCYQSGAGLNRAVSDVDSSETNFTFSITCSAAPDACRLHFTTDSEI